MSDNFIQSMIARTQARKDTLGRVSANSNKENKSQIHIETYSPPSEETIKKLPANSNCTHYNELPTNQDQYSDDVSNVEMTNSRRTFKLLAERSKYIKDWEDDYTYHSKPKTKEVDKASRSGNSAINATSTYNSTKACSNATNSPSKYYFGCNASNQSSNIAHLNSAKKESPQKRPIATIASPTKHDSVLSGLNDTPKKITWDTQLLSSLEEQGFTPTSSHSRLVYNYSKDSTVSAPGSEPKCSIVKSSISEHVDSNTNVTGFKMDINSTPQAKSSTSVSNLKNKWETNIRNASPERAIPVCPISPKKQIYVSSKNNTFGSPQKQKIESSQKIEETIFERRGRSPEKILHRSPVRKRAISPYKPNPVGKIVKGEAPMADTVPLITKEKASVKDKIAAFSNIAPQKPVDHRDPAELSVKDRLNIFEKTKDKALVPKAPFGQCIPVENKLHNPISNEDESSKGKSNLPYVNWEWKNSDIHEQVQMDRKKDMDILKNRFKKPFPLDQPMDSDSEYPESEYSGDGSPQLPPAKPPRVATSPIKFESGSSSSSLGMSPVKRLNSTDLYEANVSSVKPYEPRIKPGCLFPCLSDIESNSEAMDSQDEDIRESSLALTTSGESLGTQIQRMAEDKGFEASERLSTIAELTETQRFSNMGNDTMNALGEIDDALDEALQDKKSSPKRIKIDNYESCETPPSLQPGSSNGSRSPTTPLIHSISMYRRQKPAEVAITPLRHIVMRHGVCSPDDVPISPSVNITNCIKVLQQEEESQLKVISQASNALSMVHQHPQLQGKDEHIAAEKLLLVSTQKRQTAINEIQRLKAEGALGRGTWTLDEDSSKGSISMSNITIPLKQEFINKQMHDKAYHFVVLVKHRDQVITSELMKTPQCVIESAVTFPNLMSLHSLSAEFNIALEVYCLKTESDQRHSFKKEQSRLKLTPLRRLQKESRAPSPMVQSPGGPYAVRTSSFELVGFTNLNINTMTRNAWTLEKVPFNSPLDGHLLMRVSCTMEGGVSEKSFLTLFDDVGGFGAWNRRWCAIDGPFIKYWRYPDDETKKDCLNFMDLRTCTTRKVDVVPWDICARQHTFQLTLMRPVRKGDHTNLVQEIKETALVSKILLSADSKEERIMWCNKLNKALANIRAWDPDSLRPEDFIV